MTARSHQAQTRVSVPHAPRPAMTRGWCGTDTLVCAVRQAATCILLLLITATADARIFVTSERAGTVTMIDGARIKTMAVGTRPRGIVLSPDGKRLYVAVSHFRGQFSKTADGVVAIDPKTFTIIRRYKAGTDPEGIAMTPDGKRLYAATGRGNSVAIIETATNRVVQYITVGNRPWGINLTREGRTLYTANGLSNDVSVIDTASGRVTATIKVPDGPWGIAVAP